MALSFLLKSSVYWGKNVNLYVGFGREFNILLKSQFFYVVLQMEVHLMKSFKMTDVSPVEYPRLTGVLESRYYNSSVDDQEFRDLCYPKIAEDSFD